ncbi:MAG: PucR family transcriptional regulator [Eubacteriaceae bacterium]|nr:PucR family transcriptional regulator [Eubacteriaceae bacterium]
MALTMKYILTLPALKSFKLVAGEDGLERDVVSAGIADYEFVDGIDYDLSKAFEKDSLVISSLLFAKDKPSLLRPAIKQLNEAGVAAFAFKSVFFDNLPEEVIAYANENSFPIFSYKDGTWFENIIFQVMSAVEKDDARYLSEVHIEKMIKNTITQSEIDNIRRGISLLLSKTVSAVYIKSSDLDASGIFRAYYMSKSLRDKILVAKYNDGVFVLITNSSWNEKTHRVILDEACQILSLPVNAENLVLSGMYPATELHKAFREAYYGWAAGLLSLRKVTSYENLGVYSALLPLSSSSELKTYAQSYLRRLKGYEETIEAYINNGGDIIATSINLNCHANTIRYRLSKMKELAGAKDETDHELFRDLSIAYAVASILSKNKNL